MSIQLDYFTISVSSISEIFEIDNIRNKSSLKLLNNFGGIEGLIKNLKTNSTEGISSSAPEISQRKLIYGDNIPYTRERDTILKIIWEALQDTVLQILIVAAIISLVIGTIQDTSDGWLEGVAILITVVIILTVTATNDYMKDGQFIKLNQQTNVHNVIVTRDGVQKEIPAQDLVVGDLISVGPGEIFPVDGVLVKGNGLSVDESSITGESALVKKEVIKKASNDSENLPFLISGGKVSEGNGMMIVCAVGKNSMMEKQRIISGQIEDEEETPLQERLGIIATGLGKIGFWAGVLLTVILIFHLSIDAIIDKEWGDDEWEGLITSFILGITILIVAIPEGLPLALTLAMAYSIFRMKDENIFVRHLKGCEIMGAATNILSDKTGTLTQNKMKVSKGLICNHEYDDLSKIDLNHDQQQIIAESISRNTTAFINKSEGKIETVGNRTEGALLEMINLWGYDYNKFRDNDSQIFQFAFTSSSKKMTTVYKNDEQTWSVYSKGAAEVVIDYCDKYLDRYGKEQEMTEEKKKEFKKKVSEYSALALRVLGLAYGVTKVLEIEEIQQTDIEGNLIFLGFLGIEDPLRPEAKESVTRVQKAGITVRMVTGDKIETAVSIAKQCNILPHDLSDSEMSASVIKGKKFREAVGGLVTQTTEDGKISKFQVGNIEKFREIAPRLRVIARCSPEDKLLLVIGLKEMGEVVAVTGDGSNDAAALKQSDIGLAMMSGTQLAKESSDIILLDDNFYSVLNSVKWGRNIYASTRKFLQFQITVNIVALVVSIVGGASVENTPLSAVQMLWVNLIMDSFAALALATEPPNDNVLDSKPYGRTESMITRDMYIIIFSQAIYQITLLLFILYLAPDFFDIEESWNIDDEDDDDWNEEDGKHFTIFFYAFVMLQIFNEINCRKLELKEINIFKGFFNNWMFIAIIVGTFGIQILLIEVGGKALKCSPLAFKYHAFCIGVGVSGLIFGILTRVVVTGYRLKLKKEEGLNKTENLPLLAEDDS